MAIASGYKTLIFNALAAIAPVLELTSAADLGLTGTTATVYALLVTAVNLFLRTMTKGPAALPWLKGR